MEKSCPSLSILNGEIQMIRRAIDRYYQAPLDALRVVRYLDRRHPELNRAAALDPLWQPGAESEILIQLRWYLDALESGCCAAANKTA